jgi:hypothetical protein
MVVARTRQFAARRTAGDGPPASSDIRVHSRYHGAIGDQQNDDDERRNQQRPHQRMSPFHAATLVTRLPQTMMG